MTGRRWHGPLLALLACGASEVSVVNVARAEPNPPNPSDMALAEALFRTGRELMDAKSYSQACPKLAESYHLDPKLGTLLNLALCQEADNKTASAWGAFNEAAALARRTGQLDREKFAQQHAKALEPSLSRIVLKVEGMLPGELIELDGREVGAGSIGTALPLDPGAHRVGAWSAHKTRWEKAFVVARNAGTETIVVPVLKDAPTDGIGPAASPAAPSTTPVVASASTSVPASPDAERSSPSGSSRKTLSYVVGGAGIVALGVGTAFGVKAVSSKSDRDQHCPQHVCDARGQKAFEDGRTAANVSTAALSIGALGVGTGLVLFFTAPSASSSSSSASTMLRGTRIRPSLGRGLAGLELEHGW